MGKNRHINPPDPPTDLTWTSKGGENSKWMYLLAQD